VPAPDSCHYTIDLIMAGPYGSYAVANKDIGWGACKTKGTVTVPYKCGGKGTKNTFWSQATVAIEASGAISDGNVGDSDSVTEYCS
jgi:hypothetical protein